MAFLDGLRWDAQGLLPMILQDESTREILMVAWVNREALEKTVETRTAYFYSRSRKKLWRKGESSGHVQRVKELRVDCDGDVVLALVECGGPACHEGYASCFFRRLEPLALEGELRVAMSKAFDPREVYGVRSAVEGRGSSSESPAGERIPGQ